MQKSSFMFFFPNIIYFKNTLYDYLSMWNTL